MKFNGRCSLTKNIVANSLLFAKNGVYFVGDWLGLKPASMTYLQNGTATSAPPHCAIVFIYFLFFMFIHLIYLFTVFDSGRVSVDTSLKIDYPLNCSMWMYWTCAGKKMSQNEKILSIISK